jgi:hypothetical protein
VQQNYCKEKNDPFEVGHKLIPAISISNLTLKTEAANKNVL